VVCSFASAWSREPIVVAWIIGFPIFDTCAQFYRRVCERRDPFSPDRGHFHHHFIDAGVPVRFASPLIIFLVFLMGGVGYIGSAVGVPSYVLAAFWVFFLLLHMFLSKKEDRYVRIIRFSARKVGVKLIEVKDKANVE
jgi:UDP-GlcNAc:undecaprenyl-phosphate GlcNAc-1-phosphate transferase